MTPTEALQLLRDSLPPNPGLDGERDTAIRVVVGEVDRLSVSLDHELAVWGVLDAKVRDQEQMLNATDGELDYVLGLVAIEDPPDSDECEPGERVAWITHEVIEPLIDVVTCMVHEDDPCWFDHHGYCQAHGWLQEGDCPHKRAKALLAATSGGPADTVEDE